MSEDEELEFDLFVDAMDVPCPIPSMRVRMNIRKVPMGGILKVNTNILHAMENSIPRFCKNFNHQIVFRKDHEDGSVTFYIKRKGSKL
jgi:TusA-related sulfurtransferase